MKSILTKLIFKLNPNLRDRIMTTFARMRKSTVIIIHKEEIYCYMANGSILHGIKSEGNVIRGRRSKHFT